MKLKSDKLEEFFFICNYQRIEYNPRKKALINNKLQHFDIVLTTKVPGQLPKGIIYLGKGYLVQGGSVSRISGTYSHHKYFNSIDFMKTVNYRASLEKHTMYFYKVVDKNKLKYEYKRWRDY